MAKKATTKKALPQAQGKTASKTAVKGKKAVAK